ncbi:MAG: sodium-independent anion transporter, partial [Bacteroidetes bacterium]|nr:sodium-independent anion transporter [Bacteroidota bacterium]
AIHALEELINEYRSKGIDILFTGVIGPVRDAFNRGHLIDKIGEENCFMSVQGAVDYVDRHHKKVDAFKEYTLQANGQI